MKKIIISASITPADDAVTLEDLQQALRHLGSTHFIYTAEVELASAENCTQAVWLYVSADDSEPYLIVSELGDTEGQPVDGVEADRIRQDGVCTELYAQFPRADKYGAPAYSNDDEFAAGVVGSHGFRLDPNDFTVRAEDRGDDGCEEIWLKLMLPEGSRT